MATPSSFSSARKKAPSPPKHRHDGTSGLPFGMDWSPPPKRWEGRNTIWPHNPQTGWSYCVMIPSWIAQTPEASATADNFLKSVVFYRIHVGIQSPEGISSSHGVLRRFSDFLKLSSDLKQEFPRKGIPPAPPKHAFSRINSSRVLLEERRNALEEWMQKLLSDIELSRSAPITKIGISALLKWVLQQKVVQILLRVLMNMVQVTAKTDMEDLIARLNQEVAVKEYLATKVKDLEVELEATKQKDKEILHQAVLTEREKITQLQWDKDELYRKYSEMESNLKIEQNEKTRVQSEKTTASSEKEMLLEELETKRKEVESLQQHIGEFETKSKADIKVLVKEVKSLRNSQKEMKKVLNQYHEEKTELERIVNREKQRSTRARFSREKILHECRLLRERLQECTAKFVADEQDTMTIDLSSLPDALDLVTTSDNRIRLLVAEAQLLSRDDEQGSSDDGDNSDGKSSVTMSSEDAYVTDEETTKMLSDLLIDNAQLRLRLNSLIRNAVNTAVKTEKEGSDGTVPKKTVLNWLLDR
uniref:PX domain-containing protein n=1 Tax=Oryza nivara TaxID=4536 RepID=A0A0E0HU12_ORYNI